MRVQKKWLGIVLLSVAFLVMGSLSLMPIPYHVKTSGIATDVRPFVQVGDKKSREVGAFLLTTVSVRNATRFDYYLSQISSQLELVPNTELIFEGETERDYQERQQEYMAISKNNAIIAAFRFAHRPIKVKTLGIEVFNTSKDSLSGLSKGDLIQKIDGQEIKDAEDLIKYLSRKRKGDKVQIEWMRNNTHYKKEVQLIPISADKKKRLGLGIFPITRTKIEANPAVQITTEGIGGSSAGLMFALEVLNQLTGEDLTRGYQIAGTGTISQTGQVGQIGGVQFKVRGAQETHADFFFCPRDMESEDDNEKLAKETAKLIGTNMKIVPVSTLQEAVQYLRGLKEKG